MHKKIWNFVILIYLESHKCILKNKWMSEQCFRTYHCCATQLKHFAIVYFSFQLPTFSCYTHTIPLVIWRIFCIFLKRTRKGNKHTHSNITMLGDTHRYNSTKFNYSNNNEASCRQGLTTNINKNVVRIGIYLCMYIHISLCVSMFCWRTFFSSPLRVFSFILFALKHPVFANKTVGLKKNKKKRLERVARSFIFKNVNK